GPAISAIGLDAVTEAGATVHFTTDVPADARIDYGPTSSYGSSTPVAATLATAHSLSVSGLASGATYHYRVVSKNASGVSTASADSAFITVGARTDASWTALVNVTATGSALQKTGGVNQYD